MQPVDIQLPKLSCGYRAVLPLPLHLHLLANLQAATGVKPDPQLLYGL
jgi:hypothetical protein